MSLMVKQKLLKDKHKSYQISIVYQKNIPNTLWRNSYCYYVNIVKNLLMIYFYFFQWITMKKENKTNN